MQKNKKAKKVLLSEVIDKLGFSIISKSETFETDSITCPNINRAGIELAGFKIFDQIWDPVYLGKKEWLFLHQFTEDEIIKKLEHILEMKSPLIILNSCFLENEKVKELFLNSKKNVVTSNKTLKEFNREYLNIVLEAISPRKKIHGCLCNIFGVGTLLIGESGVGKSEVVVELIKKGHIFVADDCVEISKIGNLIYGEASELNKDFIEIRGLGILSFSRTFGIERMINKTQIEVVIELVKDENNVSIERIGSTNRYYNLLDKEILFFQIPVSIARNLGEIIETAITKYKLNLTGYDSTKLFLDKINKTK